MFRRSAASEEEDGYSSRSRSRSGMKRKQVSSIISSFLPAINYSGHRALHRKAISGNASHVSFEARPLSRISHLFHLYRPPLLAPPLPPLQPLISQIRPRLHFSNLHLLSPSFQDPQTHCHRDLPHPLIPFRGGSLSFHPRPLPPSSHTLPLQIHFIQCLLLPGMTFPRLPLRLSHGTPL